MQCAVLSRFSFLWGRVRSVRLSRATRKEGLNNGKQTEFRKWCVGNIAKYWKQDKLFKGFSGFQLPRWTLDRLIDRYNEEITDIDGRGAQTLGPVTLYEASRVDEKFKSPDEDRWAKVVADYRKAQEKG